MPDSIAVLAGLALKATVAVGLAALATVLLRRHSAAVRHLVWLATLGGLVALPLATHVVPAWRPDLPVRIEGAFLPAARIVVDVVGYGARRPLALSEWLWIIWGAGALFVLLRTVGAHLRAGMLVRDATPFPALAAAPVRLTAAVPVPVVCGLRRQTILLPEEAASWSTERLRVVLTHESTHVMRRDTLAQVLAQLACTLYWPHPLVWWASAQLRNECEQAADDGVLVDGEKASAYAGHLTDIVRGLARPIRAPQGGIAMARVSELENRLKAMFNPNRDRRSAGWKPALAATVVALCVLFPLAAWYAPAQNTGGSLSGVVKDARGGAVPRAAVTVLETGTDRKEFAITNEAGEFLFTPLPEGVYAVQVAKAGFALLEQKGIEVRAADPSKLTLVLNVGKVRDTITVTAESSRPAAVPDGAIEPKRIRVGGSVQATKVESMVRPSYPPDCKAEGIEGTALMRAVIGRDGLLVSLEAINKLVDQRLVDAAMDAVRQWRYRPTLLNGNPVEVITEIQVNFTLAK